MKITKIGHCCFVIEDNGIRVLTDPGKFTIDQDSVQNIDIIVISHEHSDHMHVESLDKVIQNNPEAVIITNKAVQKLLEAKGYKMHIVEEGQSVNIKGMIIEGFGNEHAAIYGAIPRPQCTGYFFNNKFFLPGDNFNDPGKPVDILGVPTVGPWMRTPEAIDYGLKIKPRIIIPVHDAYLKPIAPEYFVQNLFFEPAGIKYIILELNKEYEL